LIFLQNYFKVIRMEHKNFVIFKVDKTCFYININIMKVQYIFKKKSKYFYHGIILKFMEEDKITLCWLH